MSVSEELARKIRFAEVTDLIMPVQNKTHDERKKHMRGLRGVPQVDRNGINR